MAIEVGEVETAILPAFLASALINGDTDGLEPEDMKHLEAAHEYLKGFIVCDVGESFFSWSCDLPGFNLGADMAEFTLIAFKED